MASGISELAIELLGVAVQLKVYHWQTPSYARHKASDALVSAISDKTDKLVEVLQGLTNSRVRIGGESSSIALANMDDVEARRFLEHVRRDILHGPVLNAWSERDSSIANIRDDLVADVHQAQYLFTFS